MKTPLLPLLCVVGSLLAGGAASAADLSIRSDAVAVAYLKAANDSNVTGLVQFIPASNGVRVVARVENLTPGEHGFHVHEKGDLSAADLSSAGGHYNPGHAPHAARDAAQRHMGDLGNLRANDQGVATLDVVDTHLKLDGPESIIDRAVIVHADADDLKSQPAGNSGKRIAGGIIQQIRR